MAPPKGSYNARRFHEDGRRQVLEDLAAVLDSAARNGLLFKNLSSLADYVAKNGVQTAGNLLRNKFYRAALAIHLSMQRGSVGKCDNSHLDLNMIRTKLLAAELDLANTRREKARLERYISSYISDTGATRNSALLAAEHRSSEHAHYRRAFACTAQALLAVMERAEIFAIDQRKQEIRDDTARPGDEIVVGKNYAQFFILWLNKNVCRHETPSRNY